MDEEKQMAMEDIDSQNEDTTPLIEVSTLFEQSILLLAQAFNATLYLEGRVFLTTCLMLNGR